MRILDADVGELHRDKQDRREDGRELREDKGERRDDARDLWQDRRELGARRAK